MKKRCAWLRAKVKNIIRDHHWKTALFFCRNFENIVIPKMNVKSLQKSMKQFYNGKITMRRLMQLSHCKFLERLKFKAQEYQRNVIIVDESYTSKTCANCGAEHPKLGGGEIFSCVYCKHVIERDVNGARSILIKALM